MKGREGSKSQIGSTERVFMEHLARATRGESSDFDELCRRSPEIADELRELNAAHAVLIDVSARLGLASEMQRAFETGIASRVDSNAPGDETAQTPWSDTLDRLGTPRIPGERYEVRRPIGRGGMGIVFEVWDRDLRRPLAMKTILDDEASPRARASRLGRFVEEAQVTGQLEHPSIVPVHELGADSQGRVYFTMKLVEGRSLREVIDLARREAEGWTLTRVIGVLIRVTEAVAFAHSRGVIHRDLKPENVMVGRFGEVYVMDWGLALTAGDGATTAPVHTDRRDGRMAGATGLYTVEGQGLGTPTYMSPEQALGKQGDVDVRSDIYALGAILYHALAGRAPYVEPGELATAKEITQRVLAGPPPSLASLDPARPAELVAICNQAMARDPARRYATALELEKDLRAYAEGRVVRAHQTGLVVEVRKWVRRNRALSTALALAFLSAVVAGAAHYQRLRESSAARQRQLVEGHLRAASAAADRGQWSVVIDELGRARSAGPTDPVDVLLREGEAWQALSERAKAEACIAQLKERSDVGHRRAELLVLEAAHLSMSSDRASEGHATARAALDAGALGADRAFMSALIAPTSSEALRHLDDALAGEPYHHMANDLKATLLVLSGEFEKAVEHCRMFAALYPKDPQPWLGLAIANTMMGRTAEGKAALARATGSLGEKNRHTMESIHGVLERVGSLPPDALLTGGPVAMLLLSLKKDAADIASGGTNEEGEFAIPSVYCLDQAFGGMLRCVVPDHESLEPLAAVFALASKLISQPQTAESCIVQALGHHREGVLLYLRAKARLRVSPPPEQEGEYKRATREALVEAAESPSFLSPSRRAARMLLTRTERELVDRFGAEDLRDELVRRPREYLDFSDPTITESTEYAKLAVDLGNPELAHAILQKTREHFPDDIGLRLQAAEVLLAMKSFALAIEAYDAIAALDPLAEKTKTKQRKLAAAQEEARAGRVQALAGIDETARAYANDSRANEPK